MEERIFAWMCNNFTHCDDFEIRRNPNLESGDGECPGYDYVINRKNECPPDCKFYEGVK